MERNTSFRSNQCGPARAHSSMATQTGHDPPVHPRHPRGPARRPAGPAGERRWPDELPGDVDDGIKQPTCARCTTPGGPEYDWRATEARINASPAVHDRDRRPERPFPPRPLARADSPAADRHPRLARSILEFFDVIGPARDPRRTGGDRPTRSILVIPSIPATASRSDPRARLEQLPDRAAVGRAHAPARLRALRARGQRRGSMISPEVGRLDPDTVVGVHVTQIFSFPSGDRPSSRACRRRR
jgi:hypothetical protein